MSRRHLFEKSEGLVVKSLRGVIASNPALSLIEVHKVVFDTARDQSNVAVISGGGAGHEPAWGGFVGKNMLSSCVSGEIFASPSTKQILTAIEAAPSDKGTILVVLNYTGDCLNFGLACEKANAANKSPCKMIIVGDDVSVGRKGGLVGRRGLAGQVVVIKAVGAAAGAGLPLDDCVSLGSALAEQIVSMAVTLDHCHVPGRAEHAILKEDEIEIGTGPHNEPGHKKISPQPSPEELISIVLTHLLDEKDTERAYVHFEKGDEVVLLTSNFGGMSPLEMGALADEVLQQLLTDYSITPVRVYNGSLATSLNAPAFSTTLVNLTAASKKTKFSTKQMLEFLDTRTNSAWESVAVDASKPRARKEQLAAAPKELERTIQADEDLKVDPKLLEAMIRKACGNLVKAEPDLTKWDTVMGDGDCGETLKTGATAMTNALDSGLAKKGSVVQVLHELENIVESRMGGTLGGILGIFFVSLTASIQQNAKSTSAIKLWSQALSAALAKLQQYTPAKEGDRTVMDALIPFAKTIADTGSFDKGVAVAVKQAKATASMTPKLGRATYVGGMEGKDLPPDPGAMGVAEVLQGLLDGSH